MNIVLKRKKNIPSMAWCAAIKKGEENITVLAGEKVESTENAFLEGVWDDTFDKMNFSESSFFCGTGGKLKDQGLLLATPNHGLDRIVIIKREDVLYASNSIPFLMQVSGSKLDSDYLGYERDLCSIKNGLKEYKSKIPLSNNEKIQIYYFCNIYISPELKIDIVQKTIASAAKNYQEYHDGMLSTLMRIKENSQAENRKVKFGIVTTVSKGYDSAACAAMAKKIGCTTALTFNQPENYASDDGSVVARQLGYTDIRTASADHYKENKDMVESFHVATGELGTTIVFEAFGKEFRDNIVFYGERGDQFWSKNPIQPNSEFKFANQLVPGVGMTEWRLIAGFIIMPIAFYQGTHWKEICEISNSDEMKPWSVGGDYDRPIPRRMCEEMGVERKEFGQKKKGAGFNFNRDNLFRIKKRLSPVAFESFIKFYKVNKRKGTGLKQIHYIIKMLPDYFNYLFVKLHINYSFEKKEWELTTPGAPSYLINWGIEECMKYYQ